MVMQKGYSQGSSRRKPMVPPWDYNPVSPGDDEQNNRFHLASPFGLRVRSCFGEGN